MRVDVELRGLPERNIAVDFSADVGGSLVVPALVIGVLIAIALVVPALLIGAMLIALILIEGVVVSAAVVAAIVLVVGADGRAVVGANGVSRAISVAGIDSADRVSVSADGSSACASTACILCKSWYCRAGESDAGEREGEGD